MKKLIAVLSLILLASCITQNEKRGYSFELSDYKLELNDIVKNLNPQPECVKQTEFINDIISASKKWKER